MNRGRVNIGNQLNSLNAALNGISTAALPVEQQRRPRSHEADRGEHALPGHEQAAIMEENIRIAMSS